MSILKTCRKHGKTEYYINNNKVYCKHCRSENVKKRRKKLKRMSVELLGGKCQICGYSKCINALEFHHLENFTKDFGISAQGFTRSWLKIKEELKKCMLLCANCHREIHNELI